MRAACASRSTRWTRTRPQIRYAEDSSVSESSPVLKDNPLSTHGAARLLLVHDPSGQYETGEPKVWSNQLVLRNV